LRYLLQFPKETRNDIARDLAEQGRIIERTTDRATILMVLV
jgi:hypothetical protein